MKKKNLRHMKKNLRDDCAGLYSPENLVRGALSKIRAVIEHHDNDEMEWSIGKLEGAISHFKQAQEVLKAKASS